MEKPSDDQFDQDIASRRGQISVFDIWKNMSRRHPVRRASLVTGQGRSWNIAVVVSLALGFWAAWADIVGGASFGRIFIIWMVTAGVVFMVLTRLEKAVLWVAAVSGVMSAGILAAQLNSWLETDVWPVWLMSDAAHLIGIETADANLAFDWALNRTSAGGFACIGVMFLMIGLGLVWIVRRKII